MNNVPAYLLEESTESLNKSFFDLLKVKSDRHLEVEARLGTILDRKSGIRIDLGVSHPIIFSTQKSEFCFNSGVSQPFFQNVYENLSELNLEHIEEVVVIKDKVRAVYCCGKKTLMKKVRLRTFEIHFPRCQYDVRVSFSKEEVIDEKKAALTFKKKPEGFRRERDRTSINTKFYKFDLTTIKVSNKFIHEIEVEVLDFGFDRNELFNILKNIAR